MFFPWLILRDRFWFKVKVNLTGSPSTYLGLLDYFHPTVCKWCVSIFNLQICLFYLQIEMESLFLLWIKKVRVVDKTYIWVSVWWKTKNEIWEIYTPRIHWVVRGTGTPKDRDEVKRRDVWQCDGWVWVLEVIGTPSIMSVVYYKSSKRDLKTKLMNESVWWETKS